MDTASKDFFQSQGDVLYIKTSPLGPDSASNKVSQAFIEEYQKSHPKEKIIEYDIFKNTLPPFTAVKTKGKFGLPLTPEEEKEWEDIKLQVNHFKSFKKYVFAIPMWNFSLPYIFKQWIDLILHPGLTLDYKGDAGWFKGKPAYIVLSAGGALQTPKDMETGYLKHILKMMGFTDLSFEFVNGSFKPEVIENAKKNAQEKAKTWEFNEKAVIEKHPYAGQSLISEKNYKNGQKVLYITSSVMGQMSASKASAEKFIENYKKKVPGSTVTTWDLSEDKLQPFSAGRVLGKFGRDMSESQKEEWLNTKKMCEEFKSFDTYILASPMWNWNISYRMKQLFDHILQPNITAGLVKEKRAYVFIASGMIPLGGQDDWATPTVQADLGFMGFEDIKVFGVSGTANQEKRQSLIDEAVKSASAFL